MQAGVKERVQASKPKASSKTRKMDSYSVNRSASLNVLAESSRKKVQLLEIRKKAKSTSITVSSPDNDDSLALFK